MPVAHALCPWGSQPHRERAQRPRRGDSIRSGIRQSELVQLIDASRVPMRAFHIETENDRVLNVPDDRTVLEALRAGNFR